MEKHNRTTHIYLLLARFILPLVLTVIVRELAVQVLNGGMARMPQATATLASYGLAWGILNFLSSPLFQARQLGLVLVDHRGALWLTVLFMLSTGLLLGLALVSLAITPLGNWVIEDLHGVSSSLGQVAREALLWLAPLPALQGLLSLGSGTLIRQRRTDIVSYAVIAGIGARTLAVFSLLTLPFIQDKPILLPLLVTYAGILVEMGIVLWGNGRFVLPQLPRKKNPLTLAYLWHFFWPLALIMSVQGLSRPLINLFVSREVNGEYSLAVLTVVYGLGHLPYGWLNDLRSLPAAFQSHPNSLRHIRRFALGCGLLSFGIMISIYWTPVRELILLNWLGVDASLTAHSTWPLILFCFFPLAVMMRAYFHGVGLVEHRTRSLAPSGLARVAAILIMLLVLPMVHVSGATRGIAALLSGFVLETLTVWWGVRGRERLRAWRQQRS